MEGLPLPVPFFAAPLVVMCNGSDGSNRPGLPGTLLPLIPAANISLEYI